jgi:hypothetical protein
MNTSHTVWFLKNLMSKTIILMVRFFLHFGDIFFVLTRVYLGPISPHRVQGPGHICLTTPQGCYFKGSGNRLTPKIIESMITNHYTTQTSPSPRDP